MIFLISFMPQTRCETDTTLSPGFSAMNRVDYGLSNKIIFIHIVSSKSKLSLDELQKCLILNKHKGRERDETRERVRGWWIEGNVVTWLEMMVTYQHIWIVRN